MGTKLRRLVATEPMSALPPAKEDRAAKRRRPTGGAKARAVQYAALPYRVTPAGELEILLITSRESRRWVVPKGWPMKGRAPHEAAATEALEEAGAVGEPLAKPVGKYSYAKVLKSGAAAPVRVTVFPLRVTGMADTWKEQGQRELRWFPYKEAAEQVAEDELKKVILSFGATPVTRI